MSKPRHRGLAIALTASLSGCAPHEAPAGFSVLQNDSGMHHAAPQPGDNSLGTDLRGRLSVNGVLNGGMLPGQSTQWDFSFSDGRTGSPLAQFDIHHDKAMHLIVVSRDLASFAHLHPALGADGRFRLTVNAPNSDPDNRDAAVAIARPGTYFLFGEVKPSGGQTTLSRFTVRADGQEQRVPLVASSRSPSGELEVYASPERRAARVGDPYQVTMRVQRSEHHPGMPMLTFTMTIREREADGQYRDIRGLEQWLGMPGHAVLIGSQGEQAADRVFRHLHAADGTASHGRHTMQASGAQLTFMAMADDVPPPGLYRLWLQFKHRGQVLTVPMTLRL